MARRLREERPMHNSLHLKLDDQEKNRLHTETDLLKREVAQLQEQVQNAYVKIKELRDQVSYYEKESNPQLEFKF